MNERNTKVVSDDIHITHVARLPHTQTLRARSLFLFSTISSPERERESLRKKRSEKRERKRPACRIRKMRKEVYESNRIESALTFLPPPEPDIFGGERGGVGGGGEGRERERSQNLSLTLSFLLSLLVRRVCCAARVRIWIF